MYRPFTRNEKGKLQMNRVELDLVLTSLFMEANTTSDADFIAENLIQAIEIIQEELSAELEED